MELPPHWDKPEKRESSLYCRQCPCLVEGHCVVGRSTSIHLEVMNVECSFGYSAPVTCIEATSGTHTQVNMHGYKKRKYKSPQYHYIILSLAMNAVGACIYHCQGRMEHDQTVGIPHMRQHSFYCQQEDRPSGGSTCAASVTGSSTAHTWDQQEQYGRGMTTICLLLCVGWDPRVMA